jgi:hypothetical protein
MHRNRERKDRENVGFPLQGCRPIGRYRLKRGLPRSSEGS